LRGRILGVGTGARTISQALVTTNQFNNSVLVTEPTTYDGAYNTYNTAIQDPSDITVGDFGGAPLTYTIENTTPSPFSSIARCDLYQDCSVGAGTAFKDPFTGQTNGASYYVGYFTLNTDGTMTFTRDAMATNPPTPPPPTHLTISATVSPGGGGQQVTSTISFGTTNGATYTLFYTNAAGLATPVTNWPFVTPAIIGDGSVHAFTNSSTDSSRFYSVGGH
jgi:hypothetical protein